MSDTQTATAAPAQTMVQPQQGTGQEGYPQQAPAGGLRPADIQLPTDYPSREAVVNDISDWDAEGEQFLSFLNATEAPNGDTGFQPSPHDRQQHGQPQGQPQQQSWQQTDQSGYPQSGQPNGLPQGQPNGYPQGQPNGQPQGSPQDQPQGEHVQGQAPQGSPQQGTPPTGESIETLRAQVEQLQQAKAFMESQEYRDARAVMDEFRKDPVGFYEKYLPQSAAVIQQRQAAAALPVDEYARQYTDKALSRKYGEDFQFDPSEALIPGTRSYDWQTDRQIYLQQAMQSYYQEQARLREQHEQGERQLADTAARVLAEMQIPADRWTDIRKLAESIEVTPEIQIRLALSYLDQQGRLAPYRTAQPNGQPQGVNPTAGHTQVGNPQGSYPQGVPFRPSQEMPQPGLQHIPGGQGVQTTMQGLQDVFPDDFIFGLG